MGFEIVVASNTPMTPVADLDGVTIPFLTQIGYLDRVGDDPRVIRESVPYRLFKDCFLMRPDKAWTVEELMARLETSRPTVYRHLNKLKALDVLEESSHRGEGDGETTRKAYRLRYGNVAKAWNFVEANVKVAMESYRKTVDHLHELAQRESKGKVTA